MDVMPATTFGLQILTPMSKVERVSRQMAPATFTSVAGIWAKLAIDGTIVNVSGTPGKVNKLVINSRTTSIYESHDTAHGRIATMESIGIRCKISNNLYYGPIAMGDRLAVSSAAASYGKLISAETPPESGSLEIVARCEEINTSEGYMIFRTISPSVVSLTEVTTTTTTTAAPTTTTAAPTTTPNP